MRPNPDTENREINSVIIVFFIGLIWLWGGYILCIYFKNNDMRCLMWIACALFFGVGIWLGILVEIVDIIVDIIKAKKSKCKG